jgi:hypothetical protein
MSRKRIYLVLAIPALVMLTGGVLASADPVLRPTIPVMCVRITDIREVKGDLGRDRFRIEFESLNWSSTPAYGIDLARNTGTHNTSGATPFFRAASIDSNGRPLATIDTNGDHVINALDDEDDNANGILDAGEDNNADGRLDNDPMPGNVNAPNDWHVAGRTPTAISFRGGTPISKIDLLGSQEIVPGNPIIGFYQLADPETYDNGPNVRDGFVIDVDDFDVGEILSANWFLTKANGMTNAAGRKRNGFSLGTMSIARTDGGAVPAPLFAGNTGFTQSQTVFFDGVSVVPDPAVFVGEYGPTLIAPFSNPADNKACVVPNVGRATAPPPLNKLSDIAPKATLQGTRVTFAATAPCPGVIKARVVRPDSVLGQGSSTVSAGRVSFGVDLSADAVKMLSGKRSFKVKLTTRFTPRSNPAVEGPKVQRTVTVLRGRRER